MPNVVQGGKVSLPLPQHPSCALLIKTCTDQSAVIKKCTAYSTTPAVETAVIDLDASVALLSTTDAELNQARALVLTLEGKRSAQKITVRLKHDAVESALNTASNNDPVAAKAWTGDVKVRAKPLPVGASALPPESPAVRNVKAHPGMVEARCAPEPSVVGYLFQMGTDATHPEAWAPPITTNGHTHKFANLPLNQTIYVRMAIIRRGSIQSPWSPLLEIVVR